MAAEGKRWRLSGANGWGAGLSAGRDDPVAADARDVVPGAAALTLRPAPGGPLDPAALPATLGGLTLPANLVLRGGELLLASAPRRRVLRYDAARLAFTPWVGLPVAHGPAALDRAGELLVWGNPGGTRVAALHPRAGFVADDAALPAGARLRDLLARPGGEVLLLAAGPDGDAAVWAWRPGWEGMRRLPPLPPPPSGELDPARLLADAEGRVHLFDAAGGRLLALEGDGRWLPADAVRERFAPLAVAVEPDPVRGWRVRVPPDLGEARAEALPWPAPAAWPAFGPGGERLALPPETEVGARPYAAAGSIEIGPLDGGVPRVVWDRVELELDALPAGTALCVSTRTSEDAVPPPPGAAPWSGPHRLAGPPEPGDAGRLDVAVLGEPGRYLWLRLELEGGTATPAVRAATLAYPRRGIADYLPAVYREHDQDTRFLERFVGALEQSWAPLEEAVAHFDRELRPETARPAMLDFVASWLDQPLEAGWGAGGRRNAVRHGAAHLFHRGTPAAVTAALRLHLAARRGVDPEELPGAAFVWEHFRSRRPARAGGGSGDPALLFGSEVLRRLRLGASALGEATLRDLGTPGGDAVAVDANRFSVFVPRALAPGDDDLRALEAVLRREQPAGAVGEIVRTEPRLRLGAQATLGVDTVLGAYPSARLAAGADGDAPAARLDYDCLLADAEPGARPDAAAVGARDGALPWRIA